MGPRCREGIPGYPLDRAHGNAVGLAAEDAFHHVGLHHVESRMAGTVRTNIIDFYRSLSRVIYCRSHGLRQPKQFIAGIVITLRAIARYLEVRHSIARYGCLVILEDQHSSAF